MQLRKKEQETSNRLSDVRGHLIPEAEVVYSHLFLFLSPVFLFVSVEDVSHSVIPRQVWEFKQVTFQEQAASSHIYSKAVPAFSRLLKL